MNGLFVAGIAAGLALLVFAWGREHPRDADAFTAVERLGTAGPASLPVPFALAAALGAAGALVGLPEFVPAARATAAFALALVVWLGWLDTWSRMRGLLDAAIVFQDHVPLPARPAVASSPAPAAALSFRPLASAVVLLVALTVTGAGLGALQLWLGWTRMLPMLAGGLWAAIGIAFAGYLRTALKAERRVRVVLADPARASDEELFDALRRNPRSPRLLIEHARRLELRGEPLQALLEYRAAEVSGSFAEEAREGVVRARRKVAGQPGPVEGSIVLVRGTEPRMRIAPLTMAEDDAVGVHVVDPAAFVGELLALTDHGLILNLEGEIDASLAEELRPFEHLAPLIEPDLERARACSRSWRLEDPVRQALRPRYADGVPRGWVHVRVYTIQRLLVEARSHFVRVLVAPDLLQREYLEWRRAGAVGPLERAPVELSRKAVGG